MSVDGPGPGRDRQRPPGLLDVRRTDAGGCGPGHAGAVALTLLLPVVVAATVVLLVGVVVGGVHLADARAADAADAAAIAVVHARLAGQEVPCDAARRAVSRSPGRGRVVGCLPTRDGGARVAVAVTVPTGIVAPLGPVERRAEAAAAPVWPVDDG